MGLLIGGSVPCATWTGAMRDRSAGDFLGNQGPADIRAAMAGYASPLCMNA
jgi:hypothetical protein